MRLRPILSVLLCCAVALGVVGCDEAARPRELQVRCAASFEDPLRELAALFSAETGTALQLSFGPSAALARELETPDAADLYLFDDEEFAFAARRIGAARELMHLAVLRPVLAVPRGNPAEISELADIARPELRVGVPDPESCGLGRHVRTSARFIGAWHQTQQHAELITSSEAELAAALASGELDVGVLWDATVQRRPELERIEELKLEGHARRLTLAVGIGAPHVSDALCFARWLRSSDRGRPVWEAAGFQCIEGGDAFVRDPSVRAFLSANLRAAAEPALAEWARREGASLELVEGAGAELTALAAEERPHALLLFDDRALEHAGPAYADRELISSDPLVLVVYGMNPEGVESLADLGLEGLRVGLLARESGSRASLVWDELERQGLAAALLESPLLRLEDDHAVLLDAVRRKELDVALLHGTLAGAPTMRNDIVPLLYPDAELNQVFALRDDQEHPELARRMRDALRNRETNERFFHLGYRWRPRDGSASD